MLSHNTSVTPTDRWTNGQRDRQITTIPIARLLLEYGQLKMKCELSTQ